MKEQRHAFHVLSISGGPGQLSVNCGSPLWVPSLWVKEPPQARLETPRAPCWTPHPSRLMPRVSGATRQHPPCPGGEDGGGMAERACPPPVSLCAQGKLCDRSMASLRHAGLQARGKRSFENLCPRQHPTSFIVELSIGFPTQNCFPPSGRAHDPQQSVCLIRLVLTSGLLALALKAEPLWESRTHRQLPGTGLGEEWSVHTGLFCKCKP